jgi:ABC-type enterochelin transport system substrate-binding protein
MLRLPVALLLVAAAVLAAGCGRDSVPTVSELGQSVVLARNRVDLVLARITQAQSKDELLERMDEAAVVIDRAAEDLGDDGVPRGYEGEVEELVESLRQLAFDVQATAGQIREPRFDDLLAGTRGFSFASWDRANRALAALDRRGVEVAPLERHRAAALARATGGAFSVGID